MLLQKALLVHIIFTTYLSLCSMCLCFSVSPPRLVHSGSARGSPAQGSDLVFATRTGTVRGIESHIFRVETHWDLSSWTRALVQGAHAAAELIKEVSIGESEDVSVERVSGNTNTAVWDKLNRLDMFVKYQLQYFPKTGQQ